MEWNLLKVTQVKIALFSNERHFEIWFPNKKTITFFWSKLSKLQKRPNFACDNYIFPKTGGNKNKQWTHLNPPKRSIKGNESDVGNIDFELQFKRGDKFLFYTVFELHRIVHISVTRCLIEMGFESKCSILNGRMIDNEKSKLNFLDTWLIPHDRVTGKAKKCWLLKSRKPLKTG